jgi:uncharacterized membrane protein YkoI
MLAAVSTLGLAFPAFAHGNGKHDSVTMSQLPQAAQDTIKKELKGQTPNELFKEKDNGQTIYEAEYMKDGKTAEIRVGEDGMVVGRETPKETH